MDGEQLQEQMCRSFDRFLARSRNVQNSICEHCVQQMLSRSLRFFFRACIPLATLGAFLLTPILAQAQVGTRTVNFPVVASADDADENWRGRVRTNSSSLTVDTDRRGRQEIVGVRFDNVDVPQGAIVTAAHIQFTAAASDSSSTVISILGQASDNAPAFNTGDISGRATLSGAVAWAPAAWSSGASGAAERTPDLSGIVNQLVGRSGWATGNALAFVMAGSGSRTAAAIDAGLGGEAVLQITFLGPGGNGFPDVSISSPADGTSITEGELLTFTASATDPEDGNVTASISWNSSLDGDIGSGASVTAALSRGTHLISARALDSAGLSNNDTITVVVSNDAPVVTINSPSDGTSVPEGTEIAFTAAANDTEEGDLSAAIVWTSSIDGLLPASGANISTVLATGTHLITASVADSTGQPGSDAITITVVPEGGPAGSIDRQIAVASDDAEENASGSVNLNSSDLELTFDKSVQTVGMRFSNITIDPGTIITSAWIQFTVDETTSVATDLVIQGQASANAATFVNSGFNISSRPRTAAQVNWSPAAWTTAAAAGPDQRTPDLAAVIAEIVNGGGWSSGNALAIMVTGSGERVAESFNGVASSAPVLHIEFVGAGGNQKPVVNAGPDAALLIPDANVLLNGTVTDDGLPEGSALTVQWAHVGGTGAGSVNFANSSIAMTSASVTPDPGTYVLRLSATDGDLNAFDEMTISVIEGGEVLSLTQVNEFATGFANLTSPLAIPATDPAGIVYHEPSGRLFIADSEINEIADAFAIVQANIFQTPLTGGSTLAQWDFTTNSGNEPLRNREPTGITYCDNDGHFYVSNDDTKYIYRYQYDGFDFTAVDAFAIAAFSNDPEGITCDPATGLLYVIGGVQLNIVVLSYDGGFTLEGVLDLPSTAGNPAGVPVDAEGIAYDSGSGHLFVLSNRDNAIFEYTTAGLYLKKFDLSGLVPREVGAQGLSVGKSSGDPNSTSFYIADGMIDNDYDPNERDGRVYELKINRAE